MTTLRKKLVKIGAKVVRPQRAKRPLNMVFDRQIRRMNTRNPYVPCQIRDRIRAERPLSYRRRSEKRSSGKCRLKLGIEISQATVVKYMVRHPKPPSQAGA